jgi:hypothetical protein
LVHQVSTVFGDTPLNGRQRRRWLDFEHAHPSKYQYETAYAGRFRIVHDARIAVQKPPHPKLVDILQSNTSLLKPFAKPRDGIQLAGHRRWQESILLDSAKVNIQIWRQRSNTKALKELGIND